MLAIGVEQGKRIAKSDDRLTSMLSLAVSTLNDTAMLQRIVALL